MKELDVLLEPFAAGGLPKVRNDELEAFGGLLEASDSDLLAWLTGAASAPDPVAQRLVDKIRERRVKPPCEECP